MQSAKAIEAPCIIRRQAQTQISCHQTSSGRSCAARQAKEEALVDSLEMADWTLDSLKEYFEAKICAQNKAVQKAETAMDARLQGMNEFRQSLADQSATMMPRSEYTVQHASLTEKIDALAIRIAALENLDKGKRVNQAGLGSLATIIIIAVGTFVNIILVLFHLRVNP